MINYVAANFGVTSAVATTIVNVILKASTVVTVLGVIASIASGGASTIMSMGWSAVKTTVTKLVKEKGMAAAIAW